MKKAKGIMVLLLLFITVFSNVNVYAGESDIKIYIDGLPLITDELPVSINDRILVPFRIIFETLGFNVKWESEAKQINAKRQTKQNKISCNIQIKNNRMIIVFDDYTGSSKGFVNDTNFEVPPQIINGKTYIPLRAISEGLGCDVNWNGNNKTVTIVSKDKVPHKIDVPQDITEETTSETTTEMTTETEQQRNVVIYSDNNKPIVGETPGNILKDPNDPDHLSINKYTDTYRHGNVGQCAWYAECRFYEVHGIKIYVYSFGKYKECLENAKKYNDLKVITDIYDIQDNSIAVFVPKGSSEVGHKVYIEYVERDFNGNPTNVYITETNGPNSLNRNEFDPGYDGIVQKMTFEEFINRSQSNKLAGYITANK